MPGDFLKTHDNALEIFNIWYSTCKLEATKTDVKYTNVRVQNHQRIEQVLFLKFWMITRRGH